MLTVLLWFEMSSLTDECKNYNRSECSSECAETGHQGELYADPNGCPWMDCRCTSCIETITTCLETCSEHGKQVDQSHCTGDCCSACACTCQSHDYDSCQSQCTQEGKQVDDTYCSGECCEKCECNEASDGNNTGIYTLLAPVVQWMPVCYVQIT